MNEVSMTTREKVFEIEKHIKEMPQVVITPVHHFSPGVCVREITIPAGTVLTGEIHKYTHLNILTKGDMSVLTEDGIVRVQAPFTVLSPPGTKRVAYTWTECVWTTILPTDLTDIAQLEDHFIARTEAEYLTFKGAA